MDRTGLKILENNKNIQSIISVNTNILLRRFRLKFLRIMCSTSCYMERVNFENTLYIKIYLGFVATKNPVKTQSPFFSITFFLIFVICRENLYKNIISWGLFTYLSALLIGHVSCLSFCCCCKISGVLNSTNADV
jgi:hypothetical protein